MKTISEIAQDNKPICFIGSSHSIDKLAETACACGIHIQGVFDTDYDQNTFFTDLPLVSEQQVLKNKLKWNFIVASNWQPGTDKKNARHIKKRNSLFEFIDQHQLPEGNLIHPTAIVSLKSRIAGNVVIGAHSLIAHNVTVGRGTAIKEFCYISHDIDIHDHCVIQLRATITGEVTVKSNSYIGVGSTIINKSGKNRTVIGERVVIHPHRVVMQDIPDNTVVSLKNNHLPRVF